MLSHHIEKSGDLKKEPQQLQRVIKELSATTNTKTMDYLYTRTSFDNYRAISLILNTKSF